MRQLPRRSVHIEVEDARLEGALTLRPEMERLAVVINGDWGVRYAPRENHIASELGDRGFGTLLVGLLTTEETADRSTRFATDLLASRLSGVLEWLAHDDRTAAYTPGLFGVGPGVPAALQAVTEHGAEAGAIVGLDGRLDLPESVLGAVTVPTLLVVNGNERHLVAANREAYRSLDGELHHCTVQWDDDDTPEMAGEVASLAANWFEQNLGENE